MSEDSKKLLRKKKQELQKEKKKCEERLKFIDDWLRRLLNPRNDFKDLIEELKKKVKEWLKADGVGEDFFKEENEGNQKKPKSDKYDEFYYHYYVSYLNCLNIFPSQPHPSATAYQLNPTQINNFALATFGISLQRQQSMYLYKIGRVEWENMYGSISSQQCCFYQQSFTSYGLINSINGGDIIVSTPNGQQHLKVKQCSQIYRLDNGSQRVFYKYETNQNEQVVQLALLFNPATDFFGNDLDGDLFDFSNN